jgi:metal-responsive CopG/Arc/MetJ family transcriptional regulator
MKNIQVSFDENMLYEVDKVANLTKTSRSAIIRDAIKYWLKEKEIKDFERNWILSLKENPDDSQDPEAWTKIQIWSDQ